MGRNRRYLDMSGLIASAVRLAYADCRGKRLARDLNASLITAKRIALGQVSREREDQLVALLRVRLNDKREEIARLLKALEERNGETAQTSSGLRGRGTGGPSLSARAKTVGGDER